MIWTYRVFRDKIGRYSIREVFYERDGRLINYSKQPLWRRLGHHSKI